MSFPPFFPPFLWGISFARLLHGVKKPPKHHGSTRSRYQDLARVPRPFVLFFFFRRVHLSVGVKKRFEALTGNFLPFAVSYNLDYNVRPLRGY